MDDVPLQALLAPVICVGMVVAFLVYRRMAAGNLDRQYAGYRAGVLAQRLGMTLSGGDPAFNLFIRQADVDVRRGPRDGRPIHVQVRMSGAPQGVPVELVYLYRVEQESGLAQVTWRTWFDCRMTAYAKQPFPLFEVISRSAPLGPIAATQPLPAAPTGKPAVDATYAVTTAEPAMAGLLGEVLPAFATFLSSVVHLVGDGRSVSFIMKQDKAPLLANALYHAEVMAAQLGALAKRVGG
jgi:hypothetical protein